MITYEHRQGRYYMMLTADEPEEEMVELLAKQEAEGLLPLELLHVDGESIYRYDITSLQSFEDYVKEHSIDAKEVKRVTGKIAQIILIAKEWLLLEEEFCFTPDTIFVKEDGIYLPCVPGNHYDRNHQMEVLAEFFMKQVDASDRESALYIYDLYRACKSGRYTWEEPTEKKIILEERKETSCSRVLKEPPVALEKNNIKQEHSRFALFFVVCILCLLVSVFVAWSGILRSPVTGQWELLKLIAYAVVVLIVIGYTASKTVEKKEDEVKLPELEQTVVLQRDCGCESLVLIPVNSKFQSVVIEHFPFYVGSDRDHVNGVLEGEGISRIHGWFHAQGREVLYTDYNSTNGTLLNEKRVVPGEMMQVYQEDKLTFGATVYQVTAMTYRE